MKDKNNLEPSDYITFVSGSLNHNLVICGKEFNYNNIEKLETALKALEIIKEKTTDACNCLMILKARFDNLDYNNYKELFLTNLTEEEYELLKEVFSDE